MRSNIKKITDAQKIRMGSIFIDQPLPAPGMDMIDPFLLLHHWKDVLPGQQRPEDLGVGPHPHRGFSPVTLIFKGDIHHRDSLGNDSIVAAGGAQWIDAGSGIVHSERPSKELATAGGELELIQLWINTPAANKMDPPRYVPIQNGFKPEPVEGVPIITNFAGSFEGQSGPVRLASPLTLLRVDFDPGDKREFAFPEGWNVSFYQLDGLLEVDDAEETRAKQLVWFENGSQSFRLTAKAKTRILIMAGQPLKERTISYGPFVMNSEAEINQAYLDYRTGKMGELKETF